MTLAEVPGDLSWLRHKFLRHAPEISRRVALGTPLRISA
jgi:hypothetical protein